MVRLTGSAFLTLNRAGDPAMAADFLDHAPVALVGALDSVQKVLD
jgi:hypothetical protein